MRKKMNTLHYIKKLMKTITHCLLLLLLFVYTTESVNPFRSIFQRRALYYRITKAVQQKRTEGYYK